MTAYWIARATVTDDDAYAEYAKLAGPAIEKSGGKFLARGGKFMKFEGGEFTRTVVIEFPSYDAAVACYNSQEYQDAWKLQENAAVRDLYVVEAL